MSGAVFRTGTRACRIFGIFFTGFSVLLSFTALPLILMTAFMDGGGDCDEVPYGLLVFLLCFIPGGIGSALIFMEKKLQGKGIGKSIRYLSIMLVIQFSCAIVASILEPSQSVHCKDNEPLTSKDFETLQKILKGTSE